MNDTLSLGPVPSSGMIGLFSDLIQGISDTLSLGPVPSSGIISEAKTST